MSSLPPHHDSRHIPVLAAETLAFLAPRPGETYVDCTSGLGGHAVLAATAVTPGGAVLLNDSDAGNLAQAESRVRGLGLNLRVETISGNFAFLPRKVAELGMKADVALADLGFSSNQVEDAERGLSFSRDGPLDMRLDPRSSTTAADLVNSLPEGELCRLITEFGEDRSARRVATRIVQERAHGRITGTVQLAEIIRKAAGGGAGGIHPATRTFQALRIAVNDEIGSLETLLASVLRDARALAQGLPAQWLARGARVGIIAFHSLEDRPVKRAFAECVKAGALDVTNGQVGAGETELLANVRARSAKLRVIRMPL